MRRHALRSAAAAVVATARAIHGGRGTTSLLDRHRVHNRGRHGLGAVLGSFKLSCQDLSELIDVDLAVGAVTNDSHECSLERLDVATLGHKSLQIIVDAVLLCLELLVLVLRFLELLIKLVDLPVSELKLLLSSLNVSQDVVVWLIGPLNQAFV